MDIKTRYLGLDLRSPLVPSASPLSRKVDDVKRLEDAGAGAVVLYSLFEEQVIAEQRRLHERMVQGTERFAESVTYFPEPEDLHFGDEQYIDHIRKCRDAVDIPIIASLNGSSPRGWVEHARDMEEAGAQALELNLYWTPTGPQMTAEDVEARYEEVCKAVREAVKIPIALKLGPYFSSLANLARRLSKAGADGLVLFNRFWQPDVDLENLSADLKITLSESEDSRLPLNWIGILHPQINCDLAASSGVHTAEDALKLLMAGASVTQMCSALLKNGIDRLKKVEQDMRQWMEAHDYESVEQMKGSMDLAKTPDPESYKRALYVDAIQRFEL